MHKFKVFSFVMFFTPLLGLLAQDSSFRPPAISIYQEIPTDTTKFGSFTLKEKQAEQELSRMKAVENMGLYEAKKSEVIHTEHLVANLASNNARQVFARVAGLNIWENDGAGLQLSIGGRGLDPNRSSNFNVRQNGYDISADALGYPESYYTPPLEAVSKIQIVRGAASLQYGTQFGGLVNFEMKQPQKDKKLEILFRQSIGSFGFYNSFISLSGSLKKWSYYGFVQYKKMEGWRPNSQLESFNGYGSLQYKFSEKTGLAFDITRMTYLSQQAGGLSDALFNENPRMSNRARNWFQVNWNLLALHFNHRFRNKADLNIRVFGLLADRNAVGFRPNRVATIDNGSERDLLKGHYQNYGSEMRYLKKYLLGSKPMVFLAGVRLYRGYNHSVQGLGSKGDDADFKFINTQTGISNDYTFPNRNVSLFSEHIITLHKKFTVTPGLRFESIKTEAQGYYNHLQFDLAGNIISSIQTAESRIDKRQFLLGGIGLSYKPGQNFEWYGNISQNYRSITFNDMRITNPSQVIDPQLKDENGYSFDLGFRNNKHKYYTMDISGFLLHYNNRIGEIQYYDANNRVLRLRSNIGRAVMSGLETYIEADLINLLNKSPQSWEGLLFLNCAFIHSKYLSGAYPGVEGNRVEFVPQANVKTGLRIGKKNFKLAYQLAYLSAQYSDASNAVEGGVSAVNGIIPTYYVMDISASYTIKRIKIEVSSNNLSNNMYFTRRASGYPGPGIIPSDGRSFFLTLGYKI